MSDTRIRLSRRKRLLFAAAAVTLALAIPASALLAADIYLHQKYQRSAGFNVWGYRGPVVGAKQPHEYRVVFLGGSTAFGYGVNWDESIPALLERAVRARAGSERPFTVINLAMNAQGAYSFTFTLRDYAYLQYDLVCLYEGYNDLIGDPRGPNVALFRHDSPIFRLTGYMPIFPIIFKEKAAAMLAGGDVNALYNRSDKTVFRAGLATRTTAEILNAAATVGESLERQVGKYSNEGPRRIDDRGMTGCQYPWGQYCQSIHDAVQLSIARGKQVVVITQPYEVEALRERHQWQQREMAGMLKRQFGADRRVQYLDLGPAVDLMDPRLSYDRMHLTVAGNQRIADGLVDTVLALSRQPS
jgi:hypothetical protein